MSWTKQTNIGDNGGLGNWDKVASNDSGNKLIASDKSYIYIYDGITSIWTKQTNIGDNAGLGNYNTVTSNAFAKFYTKQCKLSIQNRDIMIKVLQGCLDRNDIDSYNKILECC